MLKYRKIISNGYRVNSVMVRTNKHTESGKASSKWETHILFYMHTI